MLSIWPTTIFILTLRIWLWSLGVNSLGPYLYGRSFIKQNVVDGGFT
jgi:hypothetical protein